MVYLITGKAGAGKTHYAQALLAELITKSTMFIDGDKLREETGNHDYSDEGRMRNLKDAALMAQRAEGEGKIVAVAMIAPRKDWRNMMRAHWQDSHTVYIPGGTLWKDTKYEKPNIYELKGH